jgi:hypothetical protein
MPAIQNNSRLIVRTKASAIPSLCGLFDVAAAVIRKPLDRDRQAIDLAE